jgi:hypothetical protein
MALLHAHPFQNFELEKLPQWQQLDFNNTDADFYEAIANRLETDFHATLRDGGILRFLSAYIRASREILDKSDWNPLYYALLEEASARLVFYYFFLTKRKRASLATEGSGVHWRIDPALLATARAIAGEMTKNGTRVSPYYKLSTDKNLDDWVAKNVRPVIEGYIGSTAIAPHAHIRVVDTASFKHTWDYMYADHPYGYYHWDELPYSIPLIVYLDDVGENDGPYAYVEGSDKFEQNYVLRAFTQAISCKLIQTDKIDAAHKKTIAGLPRIFRGGEMVGAHVDPELFTTHGVRKCTGPAGTAVLADGFSVVHGGGHPIAGRRRALFIAHRYPRKKLLSAWSAAAKALWQIRLKRRARIPSSNPNSRTPIQQV